MVMDARMPEDVFFFCMERIHGTHGMIRARVRMHTHKQGTHARCCGLLCGDWLLVGMGWVGRFAFGFIGDGLESLVWVRWGCLAKPLRRRYLFGPRTKS